MLICLYYAPLIMLFIFTLNWLLALFIFHCSQLDFHEIRYPFEPYRGEDSR